MAEEVDKKKELEQILKRIAQTEKGRIVNLQKEVQAYKDSIAATSDLYIKQQAINSLREAEAELARETLMSVRKKREILKIKQNCKRIPNSTLATVSEVDDSRVIFYNIFEHSSFHIQTTTY